MSCHTQERVNAMPPGPRDPVVLTVRWHCYSLHKLSLKPWGDPCCSKERGGIYIIY